MATRPVDPRDPNRLLWLMLIKSEREGHVPTLEQRLRTSQKMQARYAKETHHAADPDVVSNPGGGSVGITGYRCRMCNRPIKDPKTLTGGISKGCLRAGLATGAIELKPDGTYQIKRYNRRKKK